MKSLVLRYALLGTVILCVLGMLNWLMIARPLGYRASEVVGYLSMILAMSVIYFAIRQFRLQSANGVVSFAQGFRIGLWITVIVSVLFGVYSVLYFLIWGDDFKEWADDHFRTTLSAMEYQEYLTQMQQMESLYNNIFFQGTVMFLTVFFIGVIITLISALIQKSRT